jgi:hypothetical protein
MVTACEIMLHRRANALLQPSKSAICCGNLGWGVRIAAVRWCGFPNLEKLNQAHSAIFGPAVALF